MTGKPGHGTTSCGGREDIVQPQSRQDPSMVVDKSGHVRAFWGRSIKHFVQQISKSGSQKQQNDIRHVQTVNGRDTLNVLAIVEDNRNGNW